MFRYFQDLCSFGISGTCCVCGLMVTVYQVWFRTELVQLTNKMDAITKKIMVSDLNGKEFLLERYKKNARLMALLTNSSLILSYVTPICYCISVPVMDLFAGTYRASLPLPVASFVDHRVPFVYELIIFLSGYSIAISTAKKSANDCFFMSLLKIQTDFLKFLNVSKVLLEKELLVDKFCRRKLLIWVKLHQEIHKLVYICKYFALIISMLYIYITPTANI